MGDGSMFDPAVLDLDANSILDKFRKGVQTQAQLSLGIGFPTACSAPHSLLNSFKNLVAVSVECGYKFPQAEAMLNAAKNAPAAGGAPAAVVEETKEEEEDVDMGGLFGDDDDEY